MSPAASFGVPRVVESLTSIHPLGAVAFAPDGRTLAFADQGGHAFIWNVASAKKQRAWQLPGALHQVAFRLDALPSHSQW